MTTKLDETTTPAIRAVSGEEERDTHGILEEEHNNCHLRTSVQLFYNYTAINCLKQCIQWRESKHANTWISTDILLCLHHLDRICKKMRVKH